MVLVLSSDGLSVTEDSIDTDLERRAASFDVVRQFGMDAGMESIGEVLQHDLVQQRGYADLAPNHPYLDFFRHHDLIEVTAVPISLNQRVAGLVNYSGTPQLDGVSLRALHTLSYCLFAQMRSSTAAANMAKPSARFKPLSPREMQVMQLTAKGLTAHEIAGVLGMSARTVNQHADNVADKLGTRNRTHTVAELIRRGVLLRDDNLVV